MCIGSILREGVAHDYYSILFNFTANFFISEEKKLNSHYFISASQEMLIIFIKL
jgi:hypothetical protein